ncbi:hypothetical protein P168DRAFT_320274 [Aspergillus campestris IBT 28561]|uniref:Uncharacterized protein n=1 Tax=Aspergillus campestris (strain IBT 28561) TaxID=1392248 RepID=A0A2I1CYM5_ASPC2|nr:uncharacterized protein P168DRAFT_320274 [Aspergillus campestris IBT 28561]PKY02729.1 hypothetical protein P168DRAFT_320274 [Aspergillus campestris IBT 28561]
MIASQAAILAAHKFQAVYEAITYQMLIANQGIAGMVSMAGILPVVLAMWCLQKWHRNSPWIFFLSCAAFVLSEVALYLVPLPQIKDLDEVNRSDWPESCGGFPPPLVYCIDPSTGGQALSPQRFFRSILNPICSLIWFIIVIKWIWSYVHDGSKSPARRGTLRALIQPLKAYDWLQRFRQSKWGLRIGRVFPAFTVIVEVLFILDVCVDANCFWFIRTMNIIDFGHWSFGQLVAITVWLPVISKYFLLMGGISSYSRSRFPKGYRIVKERTTDTENDVSQSAHLPVS